MYYNNLEMKKVAGAASARRRRLRPEGCRHRGGQSGRAKKAPVTRSSRELSPASIALAAAPL